MIYLTSDYTAGAHPDIMDALVKTNLEHSVGYGLDDYTREAQRIVREVCDAPDAEVIFLVGGTQTNATAIDGILRRHEGVLAADSGHVAVHEAGAIEASGHKVLTLPHHEGKVSAEDVERYITTFYADDTHEHMVAPGMLYISQPTEYGTIYSRAELEALSDVCRHHAIPMYIDGARMAYALGSDSCDFTLADIARMADIFYIGGTKCGALFGEALVVTRPMIIKGLFSLVKQHGALLAKGRLLGVQFATLLSDGRYESIGSHAVRLAMKIREAMRKAGYEAVVPSPTNQQFFELPNELIDRLRAIAAFDYWGPRGTTRSTVRFVTSWATTPAEVDRFIAAIDNNKSCGLGE